MLDVADLERRTVVAEGHRIAYFEAGPVDGPAVVMLHGLASDAGTWDRAVVALANQGLRAVAIDLIGHGESDKPEHTYLLSDFASSVVAVLDAIGIARATIVGHSLGGAIAVVLTDTYRSRVERLVLVSAGGLGKEVHLILRAASLPVAPAVLALMTRPRLRRVYASPRVHRALRLTPDNVVNLRRAGRALGSPEGRASFFAALRGVIQPSGQRGSFLEMGLLSPEVPTLLVWNDGDPVIPVAHARATAAHLAGSRLVIMPGGGHEPHRRAVERFAAELADFVATTPPGERQT